MKKLLYISILILPFLFITECGKNKNLNEIDEETKITELSLTYDEKAILNDMEISINQIYKLKNFCMSYFDNECLIERTSSKDTYLIINITIKNKTTNTYSLLSNYFKLTDSTNNTYTEGMINDLDSPLSDEIKAGETVTGEIYFDTNLTDNFTLSYEHYSNGKKTANVEFTFPKENIVEYQPQKEEY